MRCFTSRTAAIAAWAALFSGAVEAQTSTKCSPLTQTCPADTALGRTASVSFTSKSSDFTETGNGISYGSDGANLKISKSGDAPTLVSNWYIMFGRVEVTLKAASGTGIVSSAVMQSDDLDEIDWEWLGGDSSQVQSNYFGKGVTGGYNRGAFHADPTSQSAFNTYTIDWTSEQIVWQINGQTVRTLTAASAGNQFPQTPMQIKIGAWAGGDSSNSPGTISWAGGATQYSAGPFVMYVKSVKVQDYSTGKQYKYGDNSGSWKSIQAVGGSVFAEGTSPSGVDTAAPAITSSTSGQPVPFEGTHFNPSSTEGTPNVYPWVGQATTLATANAPCYTGRPEGWTCSSNGKVLPPSSAVLPPAPSSTLAQQASPSAAPLSSVDAVITAPAIKPTNAPGLGHAQAPTAATSDPVNSARISAFATIPSASSPNSNGTATGIAAPPALYTGMAASRFTIGKAAAALGGLVGGFALFM